jgi:hypothetical protein
MSYRARESGGLTIASSLKDCPLNKFQDESRFLHLEISQQLCQSVVPAKAGIQAN